MSQFGFSSTAEEVSEGINLAGKTVVITGCNSGLGQETMRVMAMRGAHVVGTARTIEKAAEAMAGLAIEGTPLECELSTPSSVRACAKQVVALGRPIDALICNAGVMALPEPRTTLGLDLQFLTNHIGHFILVTESIEALGPKARVVVVSSAAHTMAPPDGIEFDNLSGERDYTPWKMYGQSKLANILFAKQLAKRWEGSNRTANALHPGVIQTNLTRHIDNPEAMMSKMTLKTIPQGAATQVVVAVRPEYASTTGKYFSDCQFKKPSALANDAELAEKLWATTEKLVASL